MEKSIILLGIATMLFTFSCSKDLSTTGGDLQPKTKVTLGAELEQQCSDTKTSFDSGSVLWSLNDSISVLSSANTTSGDKFKLDASSAGQSSGQFTGSLSEALQYYALYPYFESSELSGSVLSFPVSPTQQYVSGSFSNGANVSIAPFTMLTKNSLSFKNVFGVLKLSFKASSHNIKVGSIIITDNSGYKLNGTASVSISDLASNGYPTAVVSGGDSSIRLVCSDSVTVSTTETVDFYIVVPVNAFSSGFTAKVVCQDGIRTVATVKNNIIKRSTVRVMPPMTLPADPDSSIDLSADNKNANCYIISTLVPTEYEFIATKKGNSTSETMTPDKAVLVWCTTNTSTAPALNAIVDNVKLSANKKYVTFTATGLPGNALIAVKDNSDNILWSWHIWCVADLSIKGPAYGGAYIMDRELGALSNQEGNTLVAGFKYQWGRKDPFMGPVDYRIDSPTMFAVTYGDGFSSAISTTHCPNLETAIKYPTTFYPLTSGSSSWNATISNTLWGNNKTIYDPCPAGYKVPADTTFKNVSVTLGSPYWKKGYQLSYDTADLGFFPATSYMHKETGILTNVGTFFTNWSSLGGINPVYILGSYYQYNYHVQEVKACSLGLSVRCCKEEDD